MALIQSTTSYARYAVLFFVVSILTACGGAVQDHFTQRAPGAPTIDVNVDGKNAWIISWSSATRAQEYAIYWADNAEMTNAQRVVVPASEKQIDASKVVGDKIAPGSTAYLVVVALWEGKESGRSNVITYKVQPTAPVDISLKKFAAKSEIVLNNTETVPVNVSYNVYWSTDPNISVNNYQGVVKEVKNNSFVHDQSGFNDQQNVYYLVARVQDGIESPATLVTTTVNKSTNIATPLNAKAVVNGLKIIVTWDAVEGAESYRVYRNTVGELDAATVMSFSVATPILDDTTAQPNTDYYYWVVAFQKDQGSALSNRAGPIRVAATQTGSGGFVANHPPIFDIPNEFRVIENRFDVASLIASDVDLADTLVYSIKTNNGDLFEIVSRNQLRFKVAPDFESSTDIAANHRYPLTVAVTDGTNTVTKNVTVIVENENEPPTMTLKTSHNVDENSRFVANLSAADPEGTPVTFSLLGQSAGLFIIESNKLNFKVAPDYESPENIAVDHQYKVTVVAKDDGNSMSQEITVFVNDVNENPVVSTQDMGIAEHKVVIGNIDAADPEKQPLVFSIVGGVDANSLSIDSATGELRFLNFTPVFESPQDADRNNVYIVQISISDHVNTISREFRITVTPVNDPPTFTIGSAFPVPENTKKVVTLVATDPESSPLTYRVDARNQDVFELVGVANNDLVFKNAPNYEAEVTHVYTVDVYVSDGTNDVRKTISVTTTNVNEPPVFSSPNSANQVENSTATILTVSAYDDDGNSISFTMSGSLADDKYFAISITGALSFIQPADYENPLDSGRNNIYNIRVRASDGVNNVDQDISVAVTNFDEAPVLNLNPGYSVQENTRLVTDLNAVDPEGLTVQYNLSGANLGLFEIVNKQLLFKTAPDYDAPSSKAVNNTYVITISGSDGVNETRRDINVIVTDINETPISNTPTNIAVPERSTTIRTIDAIDPEGRPLTFTITGGVDANRFTLNSNTGALGFNFTPIFESPIDANSDNVYIVNVNVSDGSLSINQTYSVTVSSQNDPPVFTIGNSFTVPENTRSVVTLTATDPENNSLSYRLGASAGVTFAIENLNQLVFKTAPNYEAETVHVYSNVDIYVTDGVNEVQKIISVTTTDVNEPPSFTTINTSPAITENSTTLITSVTATDPENNTISFYMSGNGPDDAFFNITTNGSLSFKNARDYENAADADRNNVYIARVRATDGTSDSFQNISVVVTNVNESPNITSIAPINFNENLSGNVATVVASDPENNTLAYTLIQNADAQFFTLNPTTHVLTFNAPPDYENPTDSGRNNQYDLTVQVSDGEYSPQTLITIRVQNLNDTAPVFDTPVNLSINENTTLVTTINYHDDDGAVNSMSLNVLGGADQARFATFNPATRELRFALAPDFEVPTDANTNNVYEISFRLNDGVRSVDRTFIVQVNNVLSGLAAPSLVAVPMTGKTWLKWPIVSGASGGYVLYYSTQPGITPENYRTLSGARVTGITTNSYYQPLPNNTPHYFVVTATNGSEEGLNSNEVNAKPFVPTLSLNDTGMLSCSNATLNGLRCNNATDGTQLFTPQDGELGRDKSGATKIGSGEAGFDYTRTTYANGSVCVTDNQTKLTWEVKSGSGLRNATNTYTWYNTNVATNGGIDGIANAGVCSGSNCDTQSYINAVNALTGAASICGATNWRLPTVTELESLLNFDTTKVSNPIDVLFAESVGRVYWTSQPGPAAPDFTTPTNNKAFAVDFRSQPASVSVGRTVLWDRGNAAGIRLVRK